MAQEPQTLTKYRAGNRQCVVPLHMGAAAFHMRSSAPRTWLLAFHRRTTVSQTVALERPKWRWEWPGPFSSVPGGAHQRCSKILQEYNIETQIAIGSPMQLTEYEEALQKQVFGDIQCSRIRVRNCRISHCVKRIALAKVWKNIFDAGWECVKTSVVTWGQLIEDCPTLLGHSGSQQHIALAQVNKVSVLQLQNLMKHFKENPEAVLQRQIYHGSCANDWITSQVRVQRDNGTYYGHVQCPYRRTMFDWSNENTLKGLELMKRSFDNQKAKSIKGTLDESIKKSRSSTAIVGSQ